MGCIRSTGGDISYRWWGWYDTERGMFMVKLSAPWCTYQKKVKALFELDPDIDVKEVTEGTGDCDYEFDIVVRNHDKYNALKTLMETRVEFGNVTLGVHIFDAYKQETEFDIAMLKTLFDGNGLVKDIKVITDSALAKHYYVRFQPTVVQFFNDDLSDFNGNWSGLAADIAREVMPVAGVNYCTADVRENEKIQFK